jgi:hypothetical protein
MQEYIIYIILITFNIVFFLFGYIIGQLKNQNGVYYTQEKNVSFFDKQKIDQKESKKIDIDSSKVVIDIKTDNLEKKYDSLGDTKQSQEQISTAINKLKNMRG